MNAKNLVYPMENRAYEDEQSKLQIQQQILYQLQNSNMHQQIQQYRQQQHQQQQQQLQQYKQKQQQIQQHHQYPNVDQRLNVNNQHPMGCYTTYSPSNLSGRTIEGHVYEDIVHPYATSSFQRNLTLPLRKSCESIDTLTNQFSSSVRVTNRERTLIVDRINKDELHSSCAPHSETDSGSDVQSSQRNRRRKKDCRHCRTAPMEQSLSPKPFIYNQQPVYGLNSNAYALADSNYMGNGVVYAIGCNNNECGSRLAVSCSSSGESAATLPRFSRHGQDSSLDEKALITQPKNNRAGMKVNSIYAQDQWHITKDPRLFLNDLKDQSSPFQRVYSAVSSSSPSTDNNANQRRSTKDEKSSIASRWKLSSLLEYTNCTKSLVLLLVLILTLLGIGGIALYIVFEPQKLQVIQQYLRSNGRNASNNESTFGFTTESTPRSKTSSTPTPVNVIIDSLSTPKLKTSIRYNDDNNNIPLIELEPIFVPASTTKRVFLTNIGIGIGSSSTSGTTSTTTTSTTTTTPSSTTLSPVSSSTVTTMKINPTEINHIPRSARRSCNECFDDELCIARTNDEQPHCQLKINLNDTSGCAGICDLKKHECHKIETNTYRCIELEHPCLEDEWTCKNLLCIPLVKRCDGQMNCYDHSDEFNCECNLETHFHCGKQTSCLPLSKKCDGQVDCFDASDEMNCTSSHEFGNPCRTKEEFACKNKQCIPESRFCDGYKDCADGSDEPRLCQYRCNKREFSCDNHRCINREVKCNGIDDCGDGSDEMHCREHQ